MSFTSSLLNFGLVPKQEILDCCKVLYLHFPQLRIKLPENVQDILYFVEFTTYICKLIDIWINTTFGRALVLEMFGLYKGWVRSHGCMLRLGFDTISIFSHGWQSAHIIPNCKSKTLILKLNQCRLFQRHVNKDFSYITHCPRVCSTLYV